MKSRQSNTNNLSLSSSIYELAPTKRIPKNLENIYTAGIETIQDLLWVMPLRVQEAPKLANFSMAKENKLFYGSGKIIKFKAQPLFFRRSRSKVMLSNITILVQDHQSSELMTLRWFNAYPNQKKMLEVMDTISFLGMVTEFKGSLQIVNPRINPTDLADDKMLIEYPTINKVSGTFIQKYVSAIPYSIWENLAETLPEDVLKQRNLMGIQETFKRLHGKIYSNQTELDSATNRLIYEEFFQDQLKIIARRSISEKRVAPVITDHSDELTKLSKQFPYELTADQKNVLDDIKADLQKGHPMMRIVQGDVGCGKTTVAVLAAALVNTNDFQAALMCPTEALALQHYETFTSVLGDAGVGLLLGSTKAAERRVINKKLLNGEIKILIGTHSLIQDSVEFKNLGLAIIDEQHKFGVAQRLKLIAKGNGVHCLIMTATPIPRTLQLAQYGDLDISTIKTIPSGRKGIKTRIVKLENYQKYLSFIKTRLTLNEQVYVVTPAIEESETLDIKNVNERLEQYKKYFADYNVAALHGKLKPAEKASILKDFTDGKINILISTSVIEVGINVPNATVMSIYNPERFGLSSLHQLRGRVGRGNKPGFCFLNLDRRVSTEIMQRLKVVEGSTDGFVIAEADLRNRGEGDLFGLEQSGAVTTKKFANIAIHLPIFQQAYEDVKMMMEQTPQVINPLIMTYQNDYQVTSTI
jgi:ATP-dependent DNA helicase RecG